MRIDVGAAGALGKAVRHPFQLRRVQMRSKQQPLVPLLQRRAVDELCRVEQHGERNQRQEDQPPGRKPPRRIEQERRIGAVPGRSEEHTSELQSLMRISYAVFCLKKKRICSSDIYT